MAALMKYW